MLKFFSSVIAFALCLASSAAADDKTKCRFGFEVDSQSSAFQALTTPNNLPFQGVWQSTRRAPAATRTFAKHIGRLQVCLTTADGKPVLVRNGLSTVQIKSPYLTFCTAALLPDNKLLTNAHCFFDQRFVDAGLTVEEARVDFNYLSKDDHGAVRSYDVLPTELALDRDLDAMVLQLKDNRANEDLGGHIPMRMMAKVEPFQELRMIHHPNGGPQQYSVGTCQVHSLQQEIPDDRSPFRHTCESMGGSSGSLLLDAHTLAVVALHNTGGLSSERDSYNGAHKIDKINAVLGLEFTEFTPNTPQMSVAQQAFSDIILMDTASQKLAALRLLIKDFPDDPIEKQVKLMISRLEIQQNQEDIREQDVTRTQADKTLTASLLLSDPEDQIKALQNLIGRFSDQPAAKQAALVLKRLQSLEADGDDALTDDASEVLHFTGVTKKEPEEPNLIFTPVSKAANPDDTDAEETMSLAAIKKQASEILGDVQHLDVEIHFHEIAQAKALPNTYLAASKALQEVLRQQGCSVGRGHSLSKKTVDGQFGRNSAKGLEAFQAASAKIPQCAPTEILPPLSSAERQMDAKVANWVPRALSNILNISKCIAHSEQPICGCSDPVFENKDGVCSLKTCPKGKTLNPRTGACAAPVAACVGGKVRRGQRCVCPSNMQENSKGQCYLPRATPPPAAAKKNCFEWRDGETKCL
ncbi:MAG: trypsin-like serine peptidase [Pelagimonas sp.]|uniref:trypsin-like serine peptidase n=1 Tax=Pelagimonas sp. TaxID=2073170 RepID=UPI003D6C393F